MKKTNKKAYEFGKGQKKVVNNVNGIQFTVEYFRKNYGASWAAHVAEQKKHFGFSEEQCVERERMWMELEQKAARMGKKLTTKNIGNGLAITTIG